MSLPDTTAISPTIVTYQTPYQRHDANPDQAVDFLVMSPWSVQNVVFELVKQIMLRNNPKEDGYLGLPTYNPDNTKSEIFADIAYNWNAEAVKKRPAVFVQRGEASSSSKVIQQTIAVDPYSGDTTKLYITTMPVMIKCIATNLGLTEQLSGWIRGAFLAYALQIQQDFRFRRFRLAGTSEPSIYQENKENFIVTLQIDTAFDENYRITKEQLKLKTMAFEVFLGATVALTNQ